MFARSFRPRLEALDGRDLPSGTPTLSISDVSMMEGQNGQTALVFTVSLSEASSKRVAVDYATRYVGSAEDHTSSYSWAARDYVPTAGTLVFKSGETTKTITVLVDGDAAPEADEYFHVNLSQAHGATIEDGSGTGWILNDDGDIPPDDGDNEDAYWEWYDPYWYVSP